MGTPVEVEVELSELSHKLQEQSATVEPETKQESSPRTRCCSISPRVRAYKNVLGAGFSFNLIISSVIALVSLQSSLNDEEGLGLATLAIGSATFLVSGVFTSSFIRALGTKYASVVTYIMSFIYLVANFYPSWYTLVPGAICYGLSLGPTFASVNIHATAIAIKYAPDLNEDKDHLIAFFNGIVTMFFKMGYIPGNLATTIVLFSERSSSEEGIVESSLGPVCNNTEVQNLNENYVYVLLSAFVLIAITAILILFLFVDNPGSDFKFQSCGQATTVYIKDPIITTLRMLLNWRILLLLPIAVLSSFLSSSTLGILAKVSKWFNYKIIASFQSLGICIRLYWCPLGWFVCSHLWYMQWIISCNHWSISKVHSTVLDCIYSIYNYARSSLVSVVLGDKTKLSGGVPTNRSTWSL